MNKRFLDKVVLVTGGSRGIGKAIAIAFGNEGAKIVVNYQINRTAAESVVKSINESSKAIAVKADVSNPSEVDTMIKETIKRFGHIDLLVNNAGIVVDKPFKDRTLEDWKRTLDVNLTGMFICTKAVLPHLVKGGSIVNITSTNGVDTYHPDSIDYDTSKAGGIIFTKALARELAPDIRVNGVSPGWIDTDMNTDLPVDYIKQEKEKTAMGRFGKPEEIANAVLFLASSEASFITGTILIADGGYGGAV